MIPLVEMIAAAFVLKSETQSTYANTCAESSQFGHMSSMQARHAQAHAHGFDRCTAIYADSADSVRKQTRARTRTGRCTQVRTRAQTATRCSPNSFPLLNAGDVYKRCCVLFYVARGHAYTQTSVENHKNICCLLRQESSANGFAQFLWVYLGSACSVSVQYDVLIIAFAHQI